MTQPHPPGRQPQAEPPKMPPPPPPPSGKSRPSLADGFTELVEDLSGLSVDQEIRADALSAAARLLAGTTAGMTLAGVEASREIIARLWVELAQHGEAWISTGGACPCTVVDDPECPLHGDGRRP